MSKLFSYELCIRKERTLVTSGLYSVVRHLGYAAIVIAVVGSLLCYLCGGSWISGCLSLSSDRTVAQVLVSWSAMSVTFMILAIKAKIKKEDGTLKHQFSNDWVEWVRKVRYKLITDSSGTVLMY